MPCYASEQWGWNGQGIIALVRSPKKWQKMLQVRQKRCLLMSVNNNLHFFFCVSWNIQMFYFVKYIQSEHVWTGLETKYMYGGHFCPVSPVVLPYFRTSHILPGIPGEFSRQAWWVMYSVYHIWTWMKDPTHSALSKTDTFGAWH